MNYRSFCGGGVLATRHQSGSAPFFLNLVGNGPLHLRSVPPSFLGLSSSWPFLIMALPAYDKKDLSCHRLWPFLPICSPCFYSILFVTLPAFLLVQVAWRSWQPALPSTPSSPWPFLPYCSFRWHGEAGGLLYPILTVTLPAFLLVQVAWQGWRPALPTYWPAELKLLVSLCWHDDPRLRCVIRQCVCVWVSESVCVCVCVCVHVCVHVCVRLGGPVQSRCWHALPSAETALCSQTATIKQFTFQGTHTNCCLYAQTCSSVLKPLSSAPLIICQHPYPTH